MKPWLQTTIESLVVCDVKVLHKDCLDRWMAISGKSKEEACVFKCKISHSEEAQDAILSLASQSQVSVLPNADDEETQAAPVVDIINDDDEPVVRWGIVRPLALGVAWASPILCGVPPVLG